MRKERNLMRLVLFLITLGSSLYGIFVPIYYLQNGASMAEVLISLIFFFIGGAISGIFGNLIIHKLGAKAFIVLRGIVEPLVIILIRFYPVLRYPLALQNLISGFYGFAFWISMDALTATTTEDGKRGTQQSHLYAALWTASIISPFVGGQIIEKFGYSTLFLIALALVLAGGIVSFFIRIDVPVTKKMNILPTFSGSVGRHMLLVFLRGITMAATSFLFTLMIFEETKSEPILGTYGLMFGAASLAATLIFSPLADRFKETLLKGIYISSSLIWIVLSFTGLLWVMVPIQLLYQAINLNLNTFFFDLVQKKDVITLVSERMIAVCLGGTVGMCLALLLDYSQIFIVCGIVAAASIAFTRDLSR
ncbi:MAG: MFS transporter [Nanoarchaeota archaeon]|nr:MFS transporter [Nanoarchaeota archaeon]